MPGQRLAVNSGPKPTAKYHPGGRPRHPGPRSRPTTGRVSGPSGRQRPARAGGRESRRVDVREPDSSAPIEAPQHPDLAQADGAPAVVEDLDVAGNHPGHWQAPPRASSLTREGILRCQPVARQRGGNGMARPRPASLEQVTDRNRPQPVFQPRRFPPIERQHGCRAGRSSIQEGPQTQRSSSDQRGRLHLDGADRAARLDRRRSPPHAGPARARS